MRILKPLAILVAIAISFYAFIIISFNGNILYVPQIIDTPPSVEEEKTSNLTVSGVLDMSNKERSIRGINPLTNNEILNKAAEMKVDDMIENNYFAHISPSGEEASDLVSLVKYSFIAVGENLAHGEFKDDEDLVSGWMNSPGHKENILNPGYFEIGIAVKKIPNEEVWMAVQIFALPDYACPGPDRDLFVKISSNEKEMSLMRTNLEIQRIKIESSTEKDKEKILKYNAAVHEYNSLSSTTQEMVRNYNQQVELTNECISSYGF